MSNTTDTNQASELFELCKEVYERTGWETERFYWSDTRNSNNYIPALQELKVIDYRPKWLHGKDNEDNHIVPLYTSDYLLEKLPDTIGLYRDELYPDKWTAACEDGISYGGKHIDCGNEECECDSYYGESNTPLKALLKLTIALSGAGEFYDQSS